MKPLYTQHTKIPEKYIIDCFERFLIEDQAERDLSTQFSVNTTTTVCAPVSYTHLTLPTTPYV